MSYDLQNFYKATVSLDWSIGTGNFYVSVKPTVSTGWVVVSPNNATLREIVKFTATGTDSNGDYITISVRGVGGTSEQTHSIGEPVNMNITAEYWDDMNDDIAAIVASGVSNANTTTMGGVEIATDAEVDAGTATGGTGASIVLTPANVNASHNIPFVAPGTDGNLMTSNGTDWVSEAPAIPTPTFYQRVPVIGLTTQVLRGSTASTDGSVVVIKSDTSTDLRRYARDTNTGVYIQTHSVATTVGSTPYSSIIILGNYVYAFDDNNTVVRCYRYDLATLANETLCTMPSIDTSSNNYYINTWTDGTFIYLCQQKASTTGYKLAISGTTLTTSATSTCAVDFDTNGKIQFMFDGTSTYQVSTVTDGSFTIKKATDIYFVASTTTTKLISYELSSTRGCIAIPIDANRMYIGYQVSNYTATTEEKQIMVLLPITKP